MIVGWICPDSRERVPFGHFDYCDHGVSGGPSYSPFFAALSEQKIATDIRHSTLDITATQTMACPRAIYLDRTTKYHVDPRTQARATRGTALHSVMARTLAKDIWYTESNDPVRLDLRGKLFGVEVSALVDAMKRDLTKIVDAKFPSDFSVKFRDKGGRMGGPIQRPNDKIEYTVQLNIARLLLAQQEWAVKEGYDPSTVELELWDHALGASEGPLAMRAPHMTEEQMLAVRPWGSQHTIAEIVALLSEVKQAHGAISAADGVAQETLAASIPLVGEPMLNGSKCKGCEVRERCDELVVKYGRPA